MMLIWTWVADDFDVDMGSTREMYPFCHYGLLVFVCRGIPPLEVMC